MRKSEIVKKRKSEISPFRSFAISLFDDCRGQSFIEAMVAITIIITTVSSALVLVQSSINASRIGGSQIIAANLAREGVEVVRALRDTNWLQGNSFSVGLVSASQVTARPRFNSATGAWTLDFAAYTWADPLVAIKLTPTGLYQYSDDAGATGGYTLYKRMLTMGRICRDNTTGNERIVATAATTCTVASETWVGLDAISQVQYISAGGQPNTLTVDERLYDWR